jgi:hypothetical protein
MPIIALGDKYKLVVVGDENAIKLAQKRMRFITNYCKKKGWNGDHLELGQMMEILCQKGLRDIETKSQSPTLIVMGDKKIYKELKARETFMLNYCKKKGWDFNNLNFKQIMEIRSKEGWKNPK